MTATRTRSNWIGSFACFTALSIAYVAAASATAAPVELSYTYNWGADYSGSGKAGDLSASEWDANAGNNSLLNDGQISPGGVNGWGGGELGAIIQNTDPSVILDLGSAQALGELRLRYNTHDVFAVGNPASLSITIDAGAPIVFNSFPGAGPSPSTQYVSIDLTGNTGQVLNLAFTRSTEWLPFSEIDVFGPGSGATQVFASGYSYNAAPLVDYGDAGGELTDGVGKLQRAWPNTAIADTAPFVGWLNTNPDVTFNFAGEVNLAEVVVYIADSDGGAGVGLPLSITLTTLGGFNQVFNIVDPAGNGHAIPILLDGFNVLTDNLRIAISPGYQWTMLTEVEFFAAAAAPVPAPAALPAAGAMLGLLAMRRRRDRAGR